MKLYNAIYKSAVALTMATSVMLVSCNQEPEPIPAEETYLRNFIKKYGLIDQEQDWNMATTSSLTLIGDGISRDVNVLVNCGGILRRVGEFKNVRQNINIPNLDIPSFAKALYVESNGEMMMVELNGEVQMSEFASAALPSYAASSIQYENLGWLVAAEDLGSTDDMDFNDIVFRIESVAVNYKGDISSSDWQVVDEDSWVDISRGESRDDMDELEKMTSKRIRITALASGGTLPLYLHYRLAESYDYIIGYNANGSKMVSVSSLNETDAEKLEWHRWFGYDRDDIMINTGLPVGGVAFGPTGSHDALGIATIFVSDDFSMEKYSYVDYDGDNSFPAKENWEWATGDYTKYNIQGFYITVGGYKIEECKSAIYAPHKGAAPMMFLIPDSGPDGTLWHWPTERTNITDVYPQFTNWVGDVRNTDWFETYASEAREDIHYMRK